MKKSVLIKELKKCLASYSNSNQISSVSRFIKAIQKSQRLEWYVRFGGGGLVNIGDIAEQLTIELYFNDINHIPTNQIHVDYNDVSVKSYISKQPHKNTAQVDTLVMVYQQKIQDGLYFINASDIRLNERITQSDIVKYGKLVMKL